LKTFLHAVLVAGALCAHASTVQASFPGDTPDRLQIQVGGTLSTLDTQAALGNAQGGVRVMLVFEDFFNLPVHDRYLRGDAAWKFGDKSYLDLGYNNLDRAAARSIQQDATFGDYVFQAGANVEAEFNTLFIYAAYRHDFLQLDPVRISGSAGLSVVRIEAALTAAGSVTDLNGNPVTGVVTERSKLFLPVPLLGFQIDWATGDTMVLQAYARAIALDVSGIRGGMIDSGFRYYWWFHRRAAVGAGIDRLAIGLPSYESEDMTARFGYTIQGFSMFLRGAF
jgi:hypothetical protein